MLNRLIGGGLSPIRQPWPYSAMMLNRWETTNRASATNITNNLTSQWMYFRILFRDLTELEALLEVFIDRIQYFMCCSERFNFLGISFSQVTLVSQQYLLH